MQRKTPWARIVFAAKKGTGVNLSVDDVADLIMDGAIETRGLMDLEAWEEGRDPYAGEPYLEGRDGK